MVKRNLLKIPISLVFALLVKGVSGQQLHHQMLSCLGSSTTLKTGMVVLQTVGQQSVIGSATVSNLTLQQGFQQSLIFKFTPIYGVNTIVTTVYPNPFLGMVNINFSKEIAGEMGIVLYNMFGLMVYQEEKKDPAQTISLDFGHLPSGSYVLQLTSRDYTYSKILIKQ